MFEQRSKIRSLIADIEEIQKQGQQAPEAPVTVLPIEPMVDKQPHLQAVPQDEVVPQLGKIGMQLTGNVVIQLQIDLSDEVLEIRQVKIHNETMIEIRFTDGKAVHLPVKSVA